MLSSRFLFGLGFFGISVPVFDLLIYQKVTWFGVAGLATAFSCILWWLIIQAVNSKGAEAWAEGFMQLCPECESAPLRHQKVFLGTERPEKERFDCRPLCDVCGWTGTWAKVKQLRQAKWDMMTEAIHLYWLEGPGGHDD